MLYFSLVFVVLSIVAVALILIDKRRWKRDGNDPKRSNITWVLYYLLFVGSGLIVSFLAKQFVFNQ